MSRLCDSVKKKKRLRHCEERQKWVLNCLNLTSLNLIQRSLENLHKPLWKAHAKSLNNPMDIFLVKMILVKELPLKHKFEKSAKIQYLFHLFFMYIPLSMANLN